MKGFRHQPAEKKQETNWTKIGIVVICVLMAVFMVVSMFGMTWLNIFTQAKPGNSATVDFTFRDAQNRPIISSVNSALQETEGKDLLVFKAASLPVKVNVTTDEDMIPIQAVNPYYESRTIEYLMFGPELNLISKSLEGMGVGDSKVINNPYAEEMSREMTMEQFINISGEDYANISVGDQVPLAFVDRPEINLDNTTSSSYIRTAVVTKKDEGNITLNYGYPVIDISVSKLTTG